MLPARDLPQDKRPTQSESEGLETNFQSKRTGKKKSRGSNTHIRQIDFKGRAIKRDPEGHVIILKRRIHQRRQKHCKYICTQHRSTQIHKENLGGLQERH